MDLVLMFLFSLHLLFQMESLREILTIEEMKKNDRHSSSDASSSEV